MTITRNLSWFALSDIGLVREQNEDAWSALPDKGIFLLADGMGGHKAGEVASSMSCDILQDYFESKVIEDPEKSLLEAFQLANQKVFEASSLCEDYQGMGTTLDCLLIEEKAYFAHVGDSRIYLLRNEKIMQLTLDHTLMNELIDLGTLSKKEAEILPFKNSLTRAIGTQSTLNPDIGALEIENGDLFLLATDGLSNFVEEDDIRKNLLTSENLERKALSLISLAKEHGGGDNVTVILVSIV